MKKEMGLVGDNYIFRMPSDLAQGIRNREVTVTPLEAGEVLLRWQ